MSGTGTDAPKFLLVRLSAHFSVLHPGHGFPADPRLGESPVIAMSGMGGAAERVLRGRHRPPAAVKALN
jgi:hypothetical protein